MGRIAASLLVVVALWLPVTVGAQPAGFERGTQLVSAGGVLSNQSGGVGAAGSFEIGFRKLFPRTVLGLGVSAGYLRASSDSYLSPDFNFSATRIPLHFLARVNFHVAEQSRLQLFAGPAVGMWFEQYRRGPARASADAFDRLASLQMDFGVRYALRTRAFGWAQVASGTGGKSISVGAGLRIR